MDDLTGQIILVHSNHGWAGRIVQLATRSHWNHVAVLINNTQCVSAEPGGARIRPISRYTDTEEVAWSQFNLSTDDRNNIAAWAEAHEGTPYNWAAYYAIGIALTTKWATPRWMRRWLASTDDLICSQLADKALQAAGIHLFADDRVAGAVWPGSFGRYFHEHGWTDKA